MERIPYIGVSLEHVRPKEIKIEYNPNRPDLGIITGVAKAYNGITRHETGLVSYETKDGGYQLNVDESVEPVRPHVAGAVVKRIPMDEEALKDIIALQEDLHQTIGRSRRKVSIGLHNLEVVNFPVHYRAVGPGTAGFVPLDQEEELTCEEILKKLETGRRYGPILGDKDLYPLIVDDQQKILSFPPIINSELTRVGAETVVLFFDVTGTDLPRIHDSLNILVTSLADYGAEVFHVDVRAGGNSLKTPDLSTRRMKVNAGYIEDLLGVDLKGQQIIECLEASRLGASATGGELMVEIPPYRADIMHPIDIVEDVAIGYGYWRIAPDIPKTFGLGKSLDSSKLERRICHLMEGAGFIEVMNFTLSSFEKQFAKLALKPKGYVRVHSPKSLENEIIRTWIIPDLLEVLRISKKEIYPQRIFELGKTIRRENGDVVEEDHLALAITHSKAGYSDVKALLDSLSSIFEFDVRVMETEHPSFIPGRVGLLVSDTREFGILGEVSPAVLENFQLDQPVACLELNISKLPRK